MSHPTNQAMKPTPQDLVDITEHFRTSKHIPEAPLTAEQQGVKDALRREMDAQFDLPPPIVTTRITPYYIAKRIIKRCPRPIRILFWAAIYHYNRRKWPSGTFTLELYRSYAE